MALNLGSAVAVGARVMLALAAPPQWPPAQGGDKMRLGLFLTTLIGLASASHISSAADTTWIAVATLENPACDTSFGGPPGPTDWQVDIKGNTLTFTRQTTTRSSFTVDLKALQPDGSGRVVGKDDKK
jgi:hypothetical protein